VTRVLVVDDDGQILRALRGWTQVPIIVLSGRTDAGDEVDALDAGADDFVTKPFGMAELLARVRAAVRPQHLITEPGMGYRFEG